MPTLISNIRNSIEVLLSIKNEQAGDQTDLNDSLINGNGLGTPTSLPFKNSAKKESKRKLLAERKKEREDPYGKDLNSIKS